MLRGRSSSLSSLFPLNTQEPPPPAATTKVPPDIGKRSLGAKSAPPPFCINHRLLDTGMQRPPASLPEHVGGPSQLYGRTGAGLRLPLPLNSISPPAPPAALTPLQLSFARALPGNRSTCKSPSQNLFPGTEQVQD